MKYDRERQEGVPCCNYRCRYNKRGFEQSCCASYGDAEESIVRECQKYEPMYTVPNAKLRDAGESGVE